MEVGIDLFMTSVRSINGSGVDGFLEADYMQVKVKSAWGVCGVLLNHAKMGGRVTFTSQ